MNISPSDRTNAPPVSDCWPLSWREHVAPRRLIGPTIREAAAHTDISVRIAIEALHETPLPRVVGAEGLAANSRHQR